MMRGFRKALLCMLSPQDNSLAGCWPGGLIRRSLRIELDDQALVDVLTELGAIRCSLERSGHFLHVDLDPRGEADLLGELQRVDDSQLGLGAFLYGDQIACPYQRRGYVMYLAVYRHRAVRDQLACFGAR